MGERVGGRERKNDKEGGGRTEDRMKGERRREQKAEIDVEEETGCDRLYMIMYIRLYVPQRYMTSYVCRYLYLEDDCKW